MQVLDLFCGLKGWSQAFLDRGHTVTSIDLDASFHPTIVADIGKTTKEQLDFVYYDVILASPPCECFSVASIGSHWTGGKGRYIPKDFRTIESILLVLHTVQLIQQLQPKFWVLENPRGVLRHFLGIPKGTVTYCQYGEKRMKPTDLWGNIPPSFNFRSCNNGDPCHERAPRGSRTGTQGLATPALRAKIPYQLSLEMCLACETDDTHQTYESRYLY